MPTIELGGRTATSDALSGAVIGLGQFQERQAAAQKAAVIGEGIALENRRLEFDIEKFRQGLAFDRERFEASRPTLSERESAASAAGVKSQQAAVNLAKSKLQLQTQMQSFGDANAAAEFLTQQAQQVGLASEETGITPTMIAQTARSNPGLIIDTIANQRELIDTQKFGQALAVQSQQDFMNGVFGQPTVDPQTLAQLVQEGATAEQFAPGSAERNFLEFNQIVGTSTDRSALEGMQEILNAQREGAAQQNVFRASITNTLNQAAASLVDANGMPNVDNSPNSHIVTGKISEISARVAGQTLTASDVDDTNAEMSDAVERRRLLDHWGSNGPAVNQLLGFGDERALWEESIPLIKTGGISAQDARVLFKDLQESATKFERSLIGKDLKKRELPREARLAAEIEKRQEKSVKSLAGRVQGDRTKESAEKALIALNDEVNKTAMKAFEAAGITEEQIRTDESLSEQFRIHKQSIFDQAVLLKVKESKE